MTLSEMIKKYEGIRKDIMGSCHIPFGITARIDDSVEIVDHILRDLNKVAEQASGTVIRAKVLNEIDKAIDKGRFIDEELIELLRVL